METKNIIIDTFKAQRSLFTQAILNKFGNGDFMKCDAKTFLVDVMNEMTSDKAIADAEWYINTGRDSNDIIWALIEECADKVTVRHFDRIASQEFSWNRNRESARNCGGFGRIGR